MLPRFSFAVELANDTVSAVRTSGVKGNVDVARIVVPPGPMFSAVRCRLCGAAVVLPANAKLFVDGRATGGEGTERAFFTPPLARGQKFYYDVKAELVVDGKPVVEEKRVIVQAGDDLRESFPKLFAAVANPANVASK